MYDTDNTSNKNSEEPTYNWTQLEMANNSWNTTQASSGYHSLLC